MNKFNWQKAIDLDSKDYRCGHCNSDISSAKGYIGFLQHTDRATGKIKTTERHYILICHKCGKPTYFGATPDSQTPKPSYGQAIKHLPENVNALYEEARSSFSIGAYTSSIMCCRKLLMNVAVHEGANEGLSYVKYVDYLIDNRHVHQKSVQSLNLIRTIGNEANHEISMKTLEQAQILLSFISSLLKFCFEMPGEIQATTKPNNDQ